MFRHLEAHQQEKGIQIQQLFTLTLHTHILTEFVYTPLMMMTLDRANNNNNNNNYYYYYYYYYCN